LIDEICNALNKLIDRNDLSVKIIESSNEIFETLEIIENCIWCKDKKIDLYEFYESINKIENCLIELETEGQEEEEDIIIKLNNKLVYIDDKLNKEMLCKSCKEKEKKIEKLTDKYGDKEIARLLYECKSNAKYYDNDYIKWIPFDEFREIKYLAKGGFGEVHKAIWLSYNNYRKDVVLKRIYNSNDKIIDILKEVKRSLLRLIHVSLHWK